MPDISDAFFLVLTISSNQYETLSTTNIDNDVYIIQFKNDLLFSNVVFIQHYSSADQCMSAFKGPLDPSTVLGGFSGNDYSGVHSLFFWVINELDFVEHMITIMPFIQDRLLRLL